MSDEDELHLGVLCFVVHRAVETRVLAGLAEAGFDDITQARAGSLRASPSTAPASASSPSRRRSPSRPATATGRPPREAGATYAGSPDPADARATLVVFADRGAEAIAVARRVEREVHAEWERTSARPRTRALRDALERLREITDPYA